MSQILLGQACTKQLSVTYLKFTFNQAIHIEQPSVFYPPRHAPLVKIESLSRHVIVTDSATDYNNHSGEASHTPNR